MDPLHLTGPVSEIVAPGSSARYGGLYHTLYLRGGAASLSKRPIPGGVTIPGLTPGPPPPTTLGGDECIHIPLVVPRLIPPVKRLRVVWIELRFAVLESRGAALLKLQLSDGETVVFEPKDRVPSAGTDEVRTEYFKIPEEQVLFVHNGLTVSLEAETGQGSVSIMSVTLYLIEVSE